MNSILILIGIVLFFILIIIVGTSGTLRNNTPNSDTVEYVDKDGRKFTFSKWDAFKISSGAHPTYYFNENNELKRRKRR